MTIRVKLKSKKSIKVQTRIVAPENLIDINNIDISNVQDGYVLMYDDAMGKYTFVNPDALLSKAVADNTLPNDFINKLDVDLDNRIDVDGGQF